MISMNKPVVMNKNTSHRYFNRNHLRMIYAVLTVTGFLFILLFNTSCGIYKFRDISIPDSIKTVKVNFFMNKAQYVNPQLSARLTDKLRQKIVSQTRLSQTNNDDADWVIDGSITNYSVGTSGISNQQVATNRLTVGVHLILTDQKADKTTEYDVSRNFEFSANSTLEQAQAGLFDEILRGMSDDMFNRLFSNW